MNLLRVSAASILLAGFSAAGAQDSGNVGDLQAVEPGLERGWANAIEAESSLMRQANAVLTALRTDEDGRYGSEPVPESVTVADLDGAPSGRRGGNGSSGCIFMERPGSRIRAERCYYPNEGEQALNEYQFSEEIRMIRRQQAILDMMRAQEDANRIMGIQ